VKILRTIFWILAAIGFLVFAIFNWQPVELTLWQNLVLETKVPVLVLLAFVLGFLPMWAVHRSVVWGLQRRVRALENSLKNTALARERELQASAPAPVAHPVDMPVEKPGTQPGEPADPISPANPASDGASAK
jgi:uncharacterized integral membrane protein